MEGVNELEVSNIPLLEEGVCKICMIRDMAAI